MVGYWCSWILICGLDMDGLMLSLRGIMKCLYRRGLYGGLKRGAAEICLGRMVRYGDDGVRVGIVVGAMDEKSVSMERLKEMTRGFEGLRCVLEVKIGWREYCSTGEDGLRFLELVERHYYSGLKVPGNGLERIGRRGWKGSDDIMEVGGLGGTFML